MKLHKIRLFNVKKHKDLTVDFKSGSTMILGKNGTGKSTIVEGIFYLFFRDLVVSNVNEMISEDVIELGVDGALPKYKDKSFVEGWFEHKGTEYHLISALAKANCTLEVYKPDTKEWVEKSNKIKDIYAYVQEEILSGMSSEYFRNTVYTQQMGILNLVDQTEGSRQKEFDKLINIDNFQIIYDSLGKPSSELNKMSRNDLNELSESKKEKTAKLITIQKDEEGAKRELMGLKDNKDLLYKTLTTINNDVSVAQTSYDLIANDYNEMVQLGHKINATKEMVVKSEQEEEEIKKTFDFIQKKELLNTMHADINSSYSNITQESSLTLNFYDLKISAAEKDLFSLQADIHNQEILNLHVKSLSECETSLRDYETKISKHSNSVEPLKESIERINAKLSKISKEEKELEKEISRKSIESKVIIERYYNDNYSKEKINEYFNDDISSYDDICDNVCCCYCNSTLTKDSVLKQLSNDKAKYLKLNDEVSDLDIKLLSIREESSILKDELSMSVKDLSNIETNLVYNRNMINDLTDKVSNIKLEMNNIKLSMKDSTSSYHDLIKKQTTLKDSINNLKNMPALRQLRAYHTVDTDEAKEYDVNTIVANIEIYNKKKNDYETLREQYDTMNQRINFVRNGMASHKAAGLDLSKQLLLSLSKYSVEKMVDVYNMVQEKHKILSDLKLKISSFQNDVNHLNETISIKETYHKKLASDIDYINKEIENINKIVEKDALVQSKINMINVAKAYFKQDGLAKYIRQFYINKINENMSNYVHLFNFEFLPKIDETAGIEKYYFYSGGQKIAIAILMKIILNFVLKNPIKMMILDEPTPYMDAERIEAIRDLVDKIKDILQVVVITHDVEFMNIDCNKVLL